MNSSEQVIPHSTTALQNYRGLKITRRVTLAEYRARKESQSIINQCEEKKSIKVGMNPTLSLTHTGCCNEAVLKEVPVCFKQRAWGEGPLPQKDYSWRACSTDRLWVPPAETAFSIWTT